MNLATSLKATFSYFFVFLWFFFAGNVWAAKEAEIMKAADKNLQNYFYKEAMKQYKQLSQVASTEYMFMHGEIGQIKVSLAQGEFKQAEQISKQIPALFRKQLPNYKQLSIEAKMQIKLWEGRSLLLQKNTKEAYNTLSYVMQQGAGEVRLEAQFYAAKCLMLSRQWGNAATLLSEVQRKTDNRNLEFEAYCAQIELLINRESWPAVNRAFSQYFSSKLQNSKNDQVIHLLQITMLTYQNKFEEAISTYDRYLKNDMKTFRRIDHFVMLLEFASNMTSNNHEKFARRVYSKLVVTAGTDALRRLALLKMAYASEETAKRYLKQEEEQLSRTWLLYNASDLLKYIETYSNDPIVGELYIKLATTYNKLGKKEEAETSFILAFNNKLASKDVKYQAAVSLYEMSMDDNYKLADHWLNNALNVTDEPTKQLQTFNLRAELALKHDFKDKAAGIYEKVLTDYSALKSTTEYREAKLNYSTTLAKLEDYDHAARVLEEYIVEYPQQKNIDQLLLLKANYHLIDREWHLCVKTVDKLLENYPDSPFCSEAVLYAAEASIESNLINDAMGYLNKAVDTYPDRKHLPKALYLRIYLNLVFKDDLIPAVSDKKTFFAAEYYNDLPDRGAQVCMLIGDYYAQKLNYKDAISYMDEIKRVIPNSKKVSLAAYMGAYYAFLSQNYELARLKLQDYFDKYLTGSSSHTQALAYFLEGDLFSELGDYKEALEAFDAVTKVTSGSKLYYAAIGRSGDMHFSIANKSENPIEAREEYNAAVEHYDQIIKGTSQTTNLQLKAKFRKALSNLALKNQDLAEEELLSIFNSFDERQQNLEWFYYVKSGYKLAEIYKMNQEWSKALMIYKQMAESQNSFAQDAFERVEEIEAMIKPAELEQ